MQGVIDAVSSGRQESNDQSLQLYISEDGDIEINNSEDIENSNEVIFFEPSGQ